MVSKFKNLLQFLSFLSIYTPSLIASSAWSICATDLQKQVEIVVQSPSLRSLRVGVFASKLDGLANPIVLYKSVGKSVTLAEAFRGSHF